MMFTVVIDDDFCLNHIYLSHYLVTFSDGFVYSSDHFAWDRACCLEALIPRIIN